MIKMRLLATTLLLLAGLAATAHATHTEDLILIADCDGFAAEGILVLASYIPSGDMNVTVEARDGDAVLATGSATVHIDQRIPAGNPFTFDGTWDVAPAGATEAVFVLTLQPAGFPYFSLNETHSLSMECVVEDCQVRRPVWWYRHPGAWPVDQLEVGGETLTRSQVRHLMTACWRHVVAKRLFRHTVAAMLNDMVCGGAPSDVIAEANSFLADHPRHRCLNRAERREARDLRDQLREYNRRDLGDKAGDEVDPEWDESTEPVSWAEVKDLF